MCLEKASEKKVAEENIFCWKQLRRNGMSRLREYKYKHGVVQPQVQITVVGSYRTVERGYHSWVDQERKTVMERYENIK